MLTDDFLTIGIAPRLKSAHAVRVDMEVVRVATRGTINAIGMLYTRYITSDIFFCLDWLLIICSCNGVGHMAKDCTQTERSCYKCGQPGHIAVDCSQN